MSKHGDAVLVQGTACRACELCIPMQARLCGSVCMVTLAPLATRRTCTPRLPYRHGCNGHSPITVRYRSPCCSHLPTSQPTTLGVGQSSISINLTGR